MTETAPDRSLSTTDDLGKLLEKIELLGASKDREKVDETGAADWDDDTLPSLQDLKSGATSLTKTWTKWARNAGGGVAALSIIAGGIGTFVRGLNVPVPVTCTLLAGGAVLAATIAISIGVIVSADLRVRGTATAARTAGRAEVATAFLTGQVQHPTGAGGDSLTGNGSLGAAESALLFAISSPWTVMVTTQDDPGQQLLVTGVNRTSNGLRFVTATDVLSIDEIVSWSTCSTPPDA